MTWQWFKFLAFSRWLLLIYVAVYDEENVFWKRALILDTNMFKTWVNAVGVKAPFFGSCENEDSENEDLRLPPPPLRKWRPLRKRRPPYENKDTFLKQVQNRLVLPWWTKIMFMRHTTKTKILTEILNSEFDTFVIYYGIFQRWSPMEPSMGLL